MISALFDAHLHLDFACFDADREMLIQACKEIGIEHLLVAGVSKGNWDKCLSLKSYPGVWVALGVHPLFIDDFAWSDLDQLKTLAKAQAICAIGEIGLDFYPPVDLDAQAKQEAIFIAQLKLAQSLNLPVILHIRKAYDRVLKFLRQYPVKGGVAHAFSGSLQQAEQFIEMGFKLGFGGTMTYEGSKKIRHLASILPLEALVLETDSPDMPPAWLVKTERNTPLSLPLYLECLAALRQKPVTEVADQIYQNTISVFN